MNLNLKKTYLVTGGCGFIGSHLVRALLDAGAQVRVVDNLSTGKIDNIREVLDRIELIQGDLAIPEIAEQAVKDCVAVLHQAAIPSVPRSVKDPKLTQHSGEIATVNLLHAAVKAGVQRVVFAASSSAYGNTEELPKRETMYPQPRSPYAASKVACEGYMAAFANCYDIDTVCLRYFNVFGPRQDPNSLYSGVIARFCELMSSGEKPIIYGDGEQSRDFCYVENTVAANLSALNSNKNFKGEVVNIGCGERITLNSLIAEINSLLGTRIEPVYAADRLGDVRHSLADIDKAQKLLNYRPTINVREGLRRLLAFNTR